VYVCVCVYTVCHQRMQDMIYDELISPLSIAWGALSEAVIVHELARNNCHVILVWHDIRSYFLCAVTDVRW